MLLKYPRRLALLSLLSLSACGGGDGGDGGSPSSNADLNALVVAQATLTPSFASETLDYAADVTGGTDTTTVTPTTAHARATVTVNGSTVASGTASGDIALIVGDTPITVVVTAEDGSRQTYNVTVTRPQPGDNALLADLVLTSGPLDQLFDPGGVVYTASSGHLAASTRVIAAPEDPFATMTVDGIDFAADEPSVYLTLPIGPELINVNVTAEDRVTTQRYVVTSTRADLNTVANDTYVKSSMTGPDQFGSALALQTDTLIVGAPLEQSNATGVDGDDGNNSLNEAGAAYLFDRVLGVWSQDAYLKASNSDSGDRFGSAAAAVEDRVIGGAPGEQSLATGVNGNEDDNSGNDVGAAYVFEPVGGGGAWAQTAYIKASNAESNDAFATSMAANGDRLLVGAPLEDSDATGVDRDQTNNNLADAGAAYLVEIDVLGNWSQTAYLKASNTDANDQFGNALSVYGDRLVIGAWLEDSDATGVNGDQGNTGQADSGAAYAFEFSNDAWTQSAYLKASNTGTDDRFGASVAIDGDLLAIGAPREDSAAAGINGDGLDNSLVDAGAVYVFSRLTSDQWVQEAYVKASNPGLGDRFGSSVALRGNLLVVGAPGERSNAAGINGNEADESLVDSGAVYVFERNDAGVWGQIAYVKASNTDAGDGFGTAVAFDGDTLVSGAPFEQSSASGINGDETDNSQTDAGAVYVVR